MITVANAVICEYVQPYGEVEQLLSSGCFQVLDGADPVQALLQEELR